MRIYSCAVPRFRSISDANIRSNKDEIPAMSSSEKTVEAREAGEIEDIAKLSHKVHDEKDVQALRSELEHSKLGGYVPITDEEKKQSRALNRKLDLYVLPFTVMIYLLNGLDRSNLGNAQTNGFTKDLNMPSTAINTATSLFFCTFVPLQPVSTAIGKRVGQSKWLAFISLGWGILTLSHAFVKTEGQLIAVRLLVSPPSWKRLRFIFFNYFCFS